MRLFRLDDTHHGEHAVAQAGGCLALVTPSRFRSTGVPALASASS